MHEGKYYIDDKDIYTEYGVVFEKDAFNELLKFPEGKGGYAEEWNDAPNDYLAPLDATVESLSITVPFLLIANDRNDFLSKYNRFKNFLVQQKYFHLDVVDLAMRFKLRYKSMPEFKKITNVTKMNKVACKLSLTLVDDFPLERGLFNNATAAARQLGYRVDEGSLSDSLNSLPYKLQKGAYVLPTGIYKEASIGVFDKGGNFDSLPFTRGSEISVINQGGVIESVAVNMPALSYDFDGKLLGYLFNSAATEKAEQNANATGYIATGTCRISNYSYRGFYVRGYMYAHNGELAVKTSASEEVFFKLYLKTQTAPIWGQSVSNADFQKTIFKNVVDMGGGIYCVIGKATPNGGKVGFKSLKGVIEVLHISLSTSSNPYAFSFTYGAQKVTAAAGFAYFKEYAVGVFNQFATCWRVMMFDSTQGAIVLINNNQAIPAVNRSTVYVNNTSPFYYHDNYKLFNIAASYDESFGVLSAFGQAETFPGVEVNYVNNSDVTDVIVKTILLNNDIVLTEDQIKNITK